MGNSCCSNNRQTGGTGARMCRHSGAIFEGNENVNEEQLNEVDGDVEPFYLNTKASRVVATQYNERTSVKKPKDKGKRRRLSLDMDRINETYGMDNTIIINPTLDQLINVQKKVLPKSSNHSPANGTHVQNIEVITQESGQYNSGGHNGSKDKSLISQNDSSFSFRHSNPLDFEKNAARRSGLKLDNDPFKKLQDEEDVPITPLEFLLVPKLEVMDKQEPNTPSNLTMETDSNYQFGFSSRKEEEKKEENGHYNFETFNYAYSGDSYREKEKKTPVKILQPSNLFQSQLDRSVQKTQAEIELLIKIDEYRTMSQQRLSLAKELGRVSDNFSHLNSDTKHTEHSMLSESHPVEARSILDYTNSSFCSPYDKSKNTAFHLPEFDRSTIKKRVSQDSTVAPDDMPNMIQKNLDFITLTDSQVFRDKDLENNQGFDQYIASLSEASDDQAHLEANLLADAPSKKTIFSKKTEPALISKEPNPLKGSRVFSIKPDILVTEPVTPTLCGVDNQTDLNSCSYTKQDFKQTSGSSKEKMYATPNFYENQQKDQDKLANPFLDPFPMSVAHKKAFSLNVINEAESYDEKSLLNKSQNTFLSDLIVNDLSHVLNFPRDSASHPHSHVHSYRVSHKTSENASKFVSLYTSGCREESREHDKMEFTQNGQETKPGFWTELKTKVEEVMIERLKDPQDKCTFARTKTDPFGSTDYNHRAIRKNRTVPIEDTKPNKDELESITDIIPDHTRPRIFISNLDKEAIRESEESWVSPSWSKEKTTYRIPLSEVPSTIFKNDDQSQLSFLASPMNQNAVSFELPDSRARSQNIFLSYNEEDLKNAITELSPQLLA